MSNAIKKVISSSIKIGVYNLLSYKISHMCVLEISDVVSSNLDVIKKSQNNISDSRETLKFIM
jgi:hypothetical protein